MAIIPLLKYWLFLLTELIKMEWFTSSMWEELTKLKQSLASKK